MVTCFRKKSTSDNPFFDLLFRFIHKCRYFILIFWVIAFGFSLWLGPKFLDVTSMSFSAPPGSEGAIAMKAYRKAFPEKFSQSHVVVYVHTNDHNVLTHNYTRDLTLYVNRTFMQDPVVEAIHGYYLLPDGTARELLESQFVSPNHTATIITAACKGAKKDGPAVRRFIKQAHKHLDKMPPPSKAWTVGLIGAKVIGIATHDISMSNMMIVDSVIIPIALFILALMVRNLRVMLVPVFCMFLSMMFSFLVMWPVAHFWKVADFAPNVMMTILIALSIDYSLFLLTRFREEVIRRGADQHVACVRAMVTHAGRVVLVSGLTLSLTFIGLCLCPVDLIRSMGIGAAVAIASAILVNLTLTPAALLVFRSFFVDFRRCGCGCCPCKRKSLVPLAEAFAPEQLSDAELEARQGKSVWYRVGAFTTRSKGRALLVILAVVLAVAPIAAQMGFIHITIDKNQVLPRYARCVKLTNMMLRDFSPGRINPFHVLVDTRALGGVFTHAYWGASKRLITDIAANASGVAASNCATVSSIFGVDLPFHVAEMFVLNTTHPEYASPFGMGYRAFSRQFVSHDQRYALIEVQTSIDPNGDASLAWIHKVRHIAHRCAAATPGSYKYHLVGGSVELTDSKTQVYTLFPLMILIIAGIVFVFISAMFRSLVSPVRLLISVCLTVVVSYGMTVLVFIHIISALFPSLGTRTGLFCSTPCTSDLPVRPLHSSTPCTGALLITPVMSFPILIGLVLDYDVFLFSRVYEYRLLGYSDQASVVKGLYKTGGIITIAGVIMTIAFSGLMFGQSLILNEVGFLLCFSIMFDAFVVRALLMPPIMALFGRLNFWPRRMPPGVHDVGVFLRDDQGTEGSAGDEGKAVSHHGINSDEGRPLLADA